jgi:GNAT superfamily N-acetyltransferase
VFRNFFSEGTSTAILGVDVRPSHRRQGIGSELYDSVSSHAREIGATSEATTFYENEAGNRFAAAHGFEQVRAEAASALDPRLVTERASPQVDLRSVADVDPQLVYEVDLEATRDMPSTEPVDHLPYDEWRQHVLEHPLFTADGSFVAMVGDVAAAVSLLLVDPESGRAASMFTGTLREHRGHGLALAVKLASIEWAAGNGVTQLVTTNDERNAPMLAINRRLGYRPAGRRVEYVKELS